ncbi:MAG: RrF2 family transcriptional regulator [Candidatus Longimicrobiales bacterium M2_2A_002]
MLSSTGTYALRAVIYLAQREGEGPVRVDDVSAALGVPRNYLSKVLHALAKDGALRSVRGPHGGFELAVPASRLTLARVLSPFEEVDGPRNCLLGDGQCDEADPCALHGRWSGLATEVAAFFEETVLEDVVADTQRMDAILGQ